MKRAALYMRVSTLDQHPETQLHDLRQMAGQRGYEIVHEYTDRISGAKARRPGLDQMMADGRRGRFDVVLVWASDRIARSVKHFLDVLDELNKHFGLLTGQSVPIFIQAVGSFLISARILMSRFESLRSRLRALPFGRERRNISMTC